MTMLARLLVEIRLMQKRVINLLFSCICLSIICLCVRPALAEVRYDEQCTEGTITHLPVSKWQDPDSNQRGVVLLIHGITQRAYSLNVLANELAQDGFTVFGIDQRGHGRWHFERSKGQPGYACNFMQTVQDVDSLLPALKQSNPELPLFLIGESAGAGVAIRSAAHSPDVVRGIVLAGTGCKTGHAKLTWVLADTLRNFYRPNHQISVVRYQRKYGTDDLAALEENFKDKWQRPTLSAKEMLGVARFMKKNAKYAKRISPDTAVLVIQGCDDKVLKPKSAKKVLANIPSTDKRIVNVENCGHILLGTNHLKPLVTDSIDNWLSQHDGQTVVASVHAVALKNAR